MSEVLCFHCSEPILSRSDLLVVLNTKSVLSPFAFRLSQ